MESGYSILRIYVKMIFGVLCVSCALCSCSDNGERRMKKALEMAGTNRAELEKVMEHYRGDSLKLRAARFFIENMQYHFSINERFVSGKGESYYPDITRFTGAASVKRYCDSLMAAGWKIDKRTEYDIRYVNAEFMVRNIELAFHVWKKPWASEVLFGDFCKYILPYRSQNDPLSYARERFMERYTALLDSAEARNAMEAHWIINAMLKENMEYCETGNPLGTTVEETEVYDLAVPDMGNASGGIVYLCNYNAGKWIPVAMGKRSEGKSIFRKVAGRNLLVVAESDGIGALDFISDPFFTEGDGRVNFLVPYMERHVSVRFVRNDEISSCSLYYWDNGGEYFRSIPCTAENDSIFIFDNVPDNALLLNVTDGRKYDSSIGIEEDGVFKRKSWL